MFLYLLFGLYSKTLNQKNFTFVCKYLPAAQVPFASGFCWEGQRHSLPLWTRASGQRQRKAPWGMPTQRCVHTVWLAHALVPSWTLCANTLTSIRLDRFEATVVTPAPWSLSAKKTELFFQSVQYIESLNTAIANGWSMNF